MDAKVLVFLALVATALAGPISNQDFDQCSTTCTDSSKFRYATGTTYTYDYRVDTLTSIAGASEDTAKLTLQTTGDVEVLNPCEFSLQLRNTRLFHTDGNGNMKTADREVQFRSGLEAYALRFSYQDGRIEHVCPRNGDDAWTMNIKKGFLTAFQNSMDDLTQGQNITETDVTGTCKTEYTVVSNGYYTTSLKKTKDILSCTDRHSFESMIQATPYFIPSDIQSLPLMKTTHECEQSVEVGGVLKSSVCTETHIYRPFANGLSGGSTTVTQKLTYNTYKRSIGYRTGSFGSRDTLTFDHSTSQLTKDQARRSVEQKLGEICDTTRYDIRPDSPRLFSELIVAMKKMDSDDMEDIYRLLKTKTLCPGNDRTYKFFIDALPMTNTRSSVHLVSKLIGNEDVKGLQAKAWLTSLAFIPNPTSEMILDIKDLIDNEKLREDALLPVTSLINNYCKTQTSCDQDYAVLSTMSSLEKPIGYQCDATGKNFQNILLTLRAIGNAGHASRAVSVLNKCMTLTSNPMEIRIAAIEAFRRMPCTAEDKNLWNMFLDRSLDSELRISSYLALMRCPCEETLGKVASALFKEDNDQVGAFVYSHLTNLRESSNPHKQDVARMINNLALDKEFDMSPLKHSRNYEISTLINKLNTGFTAESNMIWSSSDQLPRSLAGNLTVELFGQSINIFDFGGRLEGLEYLLRNVLGPYVNSDEKGEKKVNFDKVQGSVFGRIFGNEMLFLHSKTTKSPFGNMPSKWLDVLIKLAKKQEFSFTQNFQFIDACLVVPTSAGLPVKIHVNGSAVVDLSVNGKMDLRKVGTSPRSMNVDGEIKPSAALELTGTMAVDAFVTKTGLRMRNTLHSSTSLTGRIQLNRGQQLNIELDTPGDKLEIFGAKSQFFILHNEIEQEQEMIKENRKEYEICSGTTLATVTGMELCGQLSFPNASLQLEGPYFPLTGPTSFSVTLFKRDTHSEYKLFAKRIENKRASIAQFSVNTPGSKVDRAITVDMSLNYAKKMVELNLFSPWKKIEIKGNVLNQGGMKSIASKLIIDDVSVYALTSEVKTVQQKNKIQYSPMIELTRPGTDNIQLVGLIAMEGPVKSLNIDMSLTGIQKLPYTLKSNIVNTKKEKSLTASFSSDNKNVYSIEASNLLSVTGKEFTIASLKSKFNLNTPTKQLISISGSGNYREDKALKMDTSVAIYRLMRRPASLKVSLVKNGKKKGSRYVLDVFLKSSKISAHIGSNMVTKESGSISTKMSLDYNIPRVNRNTLVFSGKLNDRSTDVYNKYSARGNLKVKKNPDYNMDLVLDLDHKRRHSEVEVDLKYGPNPKDKTKKIYFLTSLTKRINNLKNAVVNYKIKAQAPEHKVDVYLGGKHTHTPKMLDSNIQLSYGDKNDIRGSINLRDQSAKLTKMNGKMNVAWPGTEYAVNTQLVQKSDKQYSHVLNVRRNDGTKHSMSTTYKMPKAASHDFSTVLNIHGSKPVTLTGSTTLNLRNFAASGKVLSGKDTYGIVTSSRITKAPNAKINVELIHPARRMTLDVSGGKMKSKYEGSVAAAWDADNKDSKVVLDGAYLQKSFKGAVSMGGNINFQSPFTHFEDLLASFKYSSDPSEHNVDGKFSWGGKGKQSILSTMNVKKDFSLRNIDMTVELKTPFKGFRNAEISVDHNLDDSLNTVLKGNLEKENVKLVLQGQDQSDNSKTNVKGNLALRSTLENAKVITAAFSHSLSDGKLLTSAEMNHNGQKYECDMNIAHSGNGWQFNNNGDVTLKAPKQKLTTKWAHKNSDKTVKCSLISSWGKNTLKVDLAGSHELSNLRELSADLKIKSPWRATRNIEASLNHKHGSGLIQSNAFVNQNGKTQLSSKVIPVGIPGPLQKRRGEE